MSLSQRLKEAERERRRSAGLPPEPPVRPEPPEADVDAAEPVVDVTGPSADVIDLTRRAGGPAGAGGIAYDPVRNGDASSAFGEAAPVATDRMSNHPCPRCGGPTQVDLIDQVHQTVSLSCLSCFHMFRVEQS
jgi:hypothetical protein